jgi:hypothetical protein
MQSILLELCSASISIFDTNHHESRTGFEEFFVVEQHEQQ